MLCDSNAEQWMCRTENNVTRLHTPSTKIEKKTPTNEMYLEHI